MNKGGQRDQLSMQ